MGVLVSKRVEFDMGHRLPNYEGKCKHLHGHRYVLIATVEGLVEDEGSDQGMVIDFAKLKAELSRVVEQLDHKMMLSTNDPLRIYYATDSQRSRDGILMIDFIPTAENIAQWIYDRIAPSLQTDRMTLRRIELYETPTSCAIVEG